MKRDKTLGANRLKLSDEYRCATNELRNTSEKVGHATALSSSGTIGFSSMAFLFSCSNLSLMIQKKNPVYINLLLLQVS